MSENVGNSSNSTKTTIQKALDASKSYRLKSIQEKLKNQQPLSLIEERLLKQIEGGEIVKSQQAAASKLGQPAALIRWANSEGCAAFKPNGTVDLSILKPWLADNAKRYKPGKQKTIDKLKLEKLIEEVRQKRLANDVSEKLYISRSAVEESLGAQISAMQQIMSSELVDKMPVELVNIQDPAIIREKIIPILARAYELVNAKTATMVND